MVHLVFELCVLLFFLVEGKMFLIAITHYLCSRHHHYCYRYHRYCSCAAVALHRSMSTVRELMAALKVPIVQFDSSYRHRYYLRYRHDCLLCVVVAILVSDLSVHRHRLRVFIDFLIIYNRQSSPQLILADSFFRTISHFNITVAIDGLSFFIDFGVSTRCRIAY